MCVILSTQHCLQALQHCHLVSTYPNVLETYWLTELLGSCIMLLDLLIEWHFCWYLVLHFSALLVSKQLWFLLFLRGTMKPKEWCVHSDLNSSKSHKSQSPTSKTALNMPVSNLQTHLIMWLCMWIPFAFGTTSRGQSRNCSCFVPTLVASGINLFLHLLLFIWSVQEWML